MGWMSLYNEHNNVIDIIKRHRVTEHDTKGGPARKINVISITVETCGSTTDSQETETAEDPVNHPALCPQQSSFYQKLEEKRHHPLTKRPF